MEERMKSNHSDFLGTYLVPGRASELGGEGLILCINLLSK